MPERLSFDRKVVYTVSIALLENGNVKTFNVERSTFVVSKYVTVIQVVIVSGFHLFPFRTEKLSPSAPMVLHTRGRVGSRRFFRKRSPLENVPEDSFAFVGEVWENFLLLSLFGCLHTLV